ncbi:MAG: metal-dependent hydrolase [Candidatus Levybacteria bacterium]|nr:metal-dependent hydrolase [Candidatus Levybacteria bacterium]
MTGRTHDLAAFTAMTIVFTTIPTPYISLATALVAFGVNMVGGLAPDIDQPSAKLYSNIRGGKILSTIIDPLLGSHRLLSHSIVGLVLFGFLAKLLLDVSASVLLVDMSIVWWAFMIGFASHLVVDTFTKEGVPWLFPIPIRFGIPPLRFLRLSTGGFVEKSLVFPGLLLVNAYLFFTHYSKFLEFFRSFG